MPDLTARNTARDKQKIPRIEQKNAARIFAEMERLVDASDDSAGLRTGGFAQFLTGLEEPVLRLAVQPDSWGERTRARLVSVIMGGLRGIPADSASVAEIVDVSNVVMPCFLLELGRRKQYVAVEFPANPWDSGALFGLRVAPSQPMHSITKEQLAHLVTEVGEDLVGLCYFGDQQSRDNIEAELNRNDVAGSSKAAQRNSSPSSRRTKL